MLRARIKKEWGVSGVSDPFLRLMDSISGCSSKLSAWDSKENGSLAERVKDLQNRLVF